MNNAAHIARMETRHLITYRTELETRGKEAVALGKDEEIVIGLRKAWKAVDTELKNRANRYQANRANIARKAARYGR